nr:unnamed protein product [Callosobruchus analis]
MFEDSILSSSSDEELYMEMYRTKPKNQDYLKVVQEQYSDQEFLEHFRVSRTIANEIAVKFEQSQYYSYQSGEFGKLTAYEYTIIFLWFAAHEAASYKDVSDRFDIAGSTLKKVVSKMSYFLSNLSPTVITWPSVEEQVHISQQFATHGFKGVIGVIDGSHVRIDKPSEDPDSYINRKGYYSIHLQVVCDHKRKIRDVVIGFPGSVHDSRVFRASPLSTMLEQKCQQNYILGECGYPCLRHLLTPFKDMGNLTNVQQNYNWRLAKTRYVVEHTFGILKQKFRQLYHLKLRGDHSIANFIRACCVLHNLALGDDFPEVEMEPSPVSQVTSEHNYVMVTENIRDDRDGIAMRNAVANSLPL